MYDLHEIKVDLIKTPIMCKKYNYSLDRCVQNFKHFEAKITLSSDQKELIILNKKYSNMKDGDDKFKWVKSSASGKIS